MRLTEQDYIEAAAALGVDVATVKAVTEVESRGRGFLTDGRPKILFEGHWFSRYTNRAFDSGHPTISYRKWTKAYYIGGAGEYARFNKAGSLNRWAALMSTSYGLFQIMGFNHKLCGYSDVESFYAAMCESEGKQLLAFVNFVKSKGLDDELRDKRWAAFAFQYNGEGYKANAYDTKLAAAYKKFSA